MDVEALINEKIQLLQNYNRQMTEVGKKIGVLQEEGKALHAQALEVKGAINGLVELKQREEQKAKEAAEKNKGLILPEKTIVAADGKTEIAKAEEPAAPAAAPAEPALEAK